MFGDIDMVSKVKSEKGNAPTAAAPYSIETFNALGEAKARQELKLCCGSIAWVDQMLALRPFKSIDHILMCADTIWFSLNTADMLEAFSHHPLIGDLSSMKKKYAGTEQAGSKSASLKTLKQLSKLNQDYVTKNGFIFIVCATGKTADEMLGILKSRLKHSREQELRIASNEHAKITALRLRKCFRMRSPITSHVLDASNGKPAVGVTLKLFRGLIKKGSSNTKTSTGPKETKWTLLSSGVTNRDGRVETLLRPGSEVDKGIYKIEFGVGSYYLSQDTACFYPSVSVTFEIRNPGEHYHIPLLISPNSYSTYRGT